jgi:hypothetical protein
MPIEKSPDRIIDHEYNWIETEINSPSGFPVMECMRCGKKGEIANWIDFLKIHSICPEKLTVVDWIKE